MSELARCFHLLLAPGSQSEASLHRWLLW